MSDKMLSLKVRLEPVFTPQSRSRWRRVMELLEEQWRRQSEPLSDSNSQALWVEFEAQPSNHKKPVTGGQR